MNTQLFSIKRLLSIILISFTTLLSAQEFTYTVTDANMTVQVGADVCSSVMETGDLLGAFFTNSSGEIIKTIELGSQLKGLVGFSWEDIPEDIIKNNTKLSIQAFAGNGNATDGLSTAVYNKVKAASTPNGSEDVLLELEDFGEISASEVLKLKSNESND